MKIFWMAISWFIVLILIVSWFTYVVYDYDVTTQ